MVKKGSKIRFRFSREMPPPVSMISTSTDPLCAAVRISSDAAGGHGVASVQEEVQENLLQVVGRAQHRGQLLLKVSGHLHLRRPERVRDQRQHFFHHGIQIHFRKFRRARAREIQQVVDNLARAKCLLDDFLDQLVARIAAGKLLGQHLNVVGDHGQRRIHFVRHARGQQTERSELLVLEQLLFEPHPLRDVVEENQPADPVARFAQPAGQWKR